MRTEYKPNPIIIARAAELWKRALAAPIYQNEEPGHETGLNMMTGMLAAKMAAQNAPTPEALDKFGAALIESLMQPREGGRFFERSLTVDYGACEMLRAAAEKAGITMDFPWKTYMRIEDDSVSFSMGTGARRLYHYPLSGGRWLITTLSGDDMAKIIAQVEAGVDAGLTIEE